MDIFSEGFSDKGLIKMNGLVATREERRGFANEKAMWPLVELVVASHYTSPSDRVRFRFRKRMNEY